MSDETLARLVYGVRRYWRESVIFFAFSSVLFGPPLLELLPKGMVYIGPRIPEISVSYTWRRF